MTIPRVVPAPLHGRANSAVGRNMSVTVPLTSCACPASLAPKPAGFRAEPSGICSRGGAGTPARPATAAPPSASDSSFTPNPSRPHAGRTSASAAADAFNACIVASEDAAEPLRAACSMAASASLLARVNGLVLAGGTAAASAVGGAGGGGAGTDAPVRARRACREAGPCHVCRCMGAASQVRRMQWAHCGSARTHARRSHHGRQETHAPGGSSWRLLRALHKQHHRGLPHTTPWKRSKKQVAGALAAELLHKRTG